MDWALSVTTERGLARAEHFETKRELFRAITALGELSSISKARIPGGWSYIVSVKKKG